MAADDSTRDLVAQFPHAFNRSRVCGRRSKPRHEVLCMCVEFLQLWKEDANGPPPPSSPARPHDHLKTPTAIAFSEQLYRVSFSPGFVAQGQVSRSGVMHYTTLQVAGSVSSPTRLSGAY